MVEFLKDIKGKEFTYEKGKRYVAIDDLTEKDLKDKIFVRQPNSPKYENWWTEFQKDCIGDTFRIVDESELSFLERREEDRLLQL
jgi:hypothetical protein